MRKISAKDKFGIIKFYVVACRDDIQKIINKGKGDWFSSNYIRDDDWAKYLGELRAYKAILGKIEEVECEAATRNSR